MGVFRLFGTILAEIHNNPDALYEEKLETLAVRYAPFAYVGNRHSLRSFLKDSLKYLRSDCIPSEKDIEWWYGSSKLTDSGAFPDFVLAWEGLKVPGDGALLELKDSASSNIASFNSTLPTAQKALNHLTPTVWKTVQRFEKCFVGEGPLQRDCFYLIRTGRSTGSNAILSLVQGTFFETLPTSELLKALWGDVLQETGMPADLYQEVLQYLISLTRDGISRTRHIEKASIRPRLRLMSEIHPDGNPHLYAEILPGSFNLIMRHPSVEDVASWLQEVFGVEGLHISFKKQTVRLNDIPLAIKPIHHKRNGLHLVLQYRIK